MLNQKVLETKQGLSSRTNFQRSVITSILADLSFPSSKQNSFPLWETTPKPISHGAREQETCNSNKIQTKPEFHYITEFKFSAHHKSTNQVHISFKHTTIHHQQIRSSWRFNRLTHSTIPVPLKLQTSPKYQALLFWKLIRWNHLEVGR